MPVGSSYDQGFSVTLQPDGKIVTVNRDGTTGSPSSEKCVDIPQ